MAQTIPQFTSQYSQVDPRTVNVRGLANIGQQYGLTYDVNEITNTFNKATDAQYAAKTREYQTAENQFGQNLFRTQRSVIDALRQQRNQQLATGMSTGLQAAAETASAMGMQQEGAAGALQLANQRQALGSEIGAAYAQNIADAMKYANTTKQSIANLDTQLYNADTLGYNAELAAKGQMYGADVNAYLGQLGLLGTYEQANATRAAAATTANATLRAAEIAANANQSQFFLDQYKTYGDNISGLNTMEKIDTIANAMSLDPQWKDKTPEQLRTIVANMYNINTTGPVLPVRSGLDKLGMTMLNGYGLDKALGSDRITKHAEVLKNADAVKIAELINKMKK